jgi:hypothetical protein
MIRKLLPLYIVIGFTFSLWAQKNVVPVTQSKLTGINLPQGTKQDKRLLSEVGAETLLEMESKKAGTTIPSAEVFEIPAVSISRFSADSLIARLLRQGWNVYPVATDRDYMWLEKGSQYLLSYFKSTSKLSDLYIGVADSIPAFDRSTQVTVTSSKPSANSLPSVTTSNGKKETNQPGMVTPSAASRTGKEEKPTTLPPSPQSTPQQSISSTFSGTYAYFTTNFDDGWTSTVQDEWILVTKGNVRVYLWYVLPYNVSNFSGTGLMERDYYWDTYVTQYFNIQTKQYRDNGEVISSFKPNYVEGWGIDRKTGERRFLGMTISIAPNAAFITLASTPDEATLRQQFPKANDQYTSDLTDMKRYNKFAVAKADVVGTWSESSSAAMNYYYTGTGNYAGMGVAAVSGTFVFKADGTYTSEHKGATGMVGSLNTFQQEYKGKYQVSNWELIVDNRFEGKTETNFAYFEAVRGGRVLHLNNKQYTGQWYHLVRDPNK